MTNASAKKPVIALMGEFSAGKSTLSNLLLGEGRSPVKVTATQLPPLWFAEGCDRMVAIGHDGSETEIEPDDLDAVDVADTRCVRVWMRAEVLEMMDIIDMPGNSDPNMSSEVWQALLPEVDGAIWCSHATQAWRQSEAATWEEMDSGLHANSLMLLTRYDRLLTERDRLRVLRRVEAEAGGLFRAIHPIALIDALAAGDDRDRWAASGAEAFITTLLDIVEGLGGVRADTGAASTDGANRAPGQAADAAMPLVLGAQDRIATPVAAAQPSSAGPHRPTARDVLSQEADDDLSAFPAPDAGTVERSEPRPATPAGARPGTVFARPAETEVPRPVVPRRVAVQDGRSRPFP